MQLPFPLYHGTSTLFLNDIVEYGLGGKKPFEELNILDLARKIQPHAKEHLMESHKSFVPSFQQMVEQNSGLFWNFQHGETYMSPYDLTAIRYASHNIYGSELLSHTMELLRALVEKNIDKVTKDIFQEHRKEFRLLEVLPAPILIEAKGVSPDFLAGEHVNGDHIEILRQLMNNPFNPTIDKNSYCEMKKSGMQSNFRLVKAVPAEQLTVWLINFTSPRQKLFPKYTLHRLSMQPCTAIDDFDPFANESDVQKWEDFKAYLNQLSDL